MSVRPIPIHAQSHRARPLALLMGAVALAAVVGLSIQWPPSFPDWLSLAIWFGLYTAARLFAVPIFAGELNFSHTLLLAAFFAFDLSAALWIACLGVLVEQAIRLLISVRAHPGPVSLAGTLNAAGIALARVVFSLILADAAFRLAGGRVTTSAIGPSLVSLAALFSTYLLATTLIHTALAAGVSPMPAREWLRHHRRHLLLFLALALPLPLSNIIAVFYLRTEFGLFVVFAVSMFLLMALLYVLSVFKASNDKRRREMASLNAVGQAIVNSLDLPELLEAIHQHISALMDAQNFYVALYNEDYDELAFPFAVEDGQPTRYRSRTASNGLTEYVLRNRVPLLIPSDVPREIKRLELDEIPGEQAQCWLGVPITIGDRVLGVIAVQSKTRTYLYDHHDVSLLNTIASQTAVAIENAQLYASTRRRAAELAILNSVSTAVGSLLKLDQVMEAIVTSVGPVVGCQKAAIFLYQDGGLNLAASRGLSQAFLDQLPEMMRTARGEGSRLDVVRQPLIVNDVRLDARFETSRAAAEPEGIRAFADVPLQAREHVIGALAVFYIEPHRFTVAELDLLTTFANQAAVAVANATLYAQTDEALARRVDELAALEEIGRELTGTLDVSRVIERVLDTAMESANAHNGLVALVEPEQHMLNLVAARGYPPGVLATASIQEWLATHPIIHAALRDGSAIAVDDVREYASYRALDPAIQSVLVTPILREGQTLGVISLTSRQRAAFSPETASFIGQLATQAAIAIRNAQLYQQTQNRLREMSILYDMGRQFTATQDLADLGRELTRQMAAALSTTHCALELIARQPGQPNLIVEHAAPGVEPILSSSSGAEPIPGLDDLRRSRQPIILYASDARPNSPEYPFLQAHQIQALIELPLIAGSELIGHITWMHIRPRTPFGADEIRFAQTLANQASIGLENAQLSHERGKRIADLSHLYQASLALAASIELDQALDRIALIAREITDSDTVTVFLYEAQTGRVTRGSHLAGSNQHSDASDVRPGGATHRVIATRQPLLVNDILEETNVNPRVLEAGIRAVIAMPILRKNEVLGVLYVNSRTPGKYNADSVQLVQLLANEAAVAIDNARLFGEVAQARDRLAAILNSSRDGVLMFDVSGRVILANPMLEQLWNVRRAELEGQSLLRLLDVPEMDLAARLGYSSGVLRTLLEQATTGVPVRWDKETFTLPGARPRSIDRSGMPVLDENGGLVGWMLVLRDMTEEHELQKLREDLSNMIVHDLRSPLVAILDSYQLIAEGVPQTRTNLASQALEIGQRSTRKLLDLVNSLLDISRFEHGQMRLDTEFAALRPLVDSAVEQLAPLANDQGVLIRNNIPAELPLVKVEEDQITRVLANLIDNAVKFSPMGSQVIISAQPYANGREEAEFVLCSVRDMGPGIPPEYRERVFERFIQLSEGLERRRGTGLGLAFCKLAIEAHGGAIWVEDPPDGPGSQFCFTLPIASVPAL